MGGETQFSRPSVTRPSVSIRLRCPRARDERGAKHRLLVEYFLDGCLGKSSVCALSPICPWLVLACPWKKWKWLGHTHTETHLTSRTRCVWGNTVVPELPSPPQRARPFHSHSIQTQASPFHLSRGVIRSITLVFWVGHLFQPFFIIVWCMDCLFCRFPGPKPVVPSLAQEAIAFHCHRVPDSFQLPLVMDS